MINWRLNGWKLWEFFLGWLEIFSRELSEKAQILIYFKLFTAVFLKTPNKFFSVE